MGGFHESDDTVEQGLGEISGVSCTVAVTSRPWQLDVDALVVSAGPDGLGRLGSDVRDKVPGLRWPDADLRALTPDRVQVLTLPPNPESDTARLRWIVLACARDTSLPREGLAGDYPGTPEAAGRGAAAAIREAVDRRAEAVALPLLGAGAIGLPSSIAAGVAVEAVRRVLRETAPSSVRRIVFVGLDEETRHSIDRAWRDAVEADADQPVQRVSPLPTRKAVAPSAAPTESAADPAGAGSPAPDGGPKWHFRNLTPGVLDVLRHATAVVDAGLYPPGEVDPPLVLLSALMRRNIPRREPLGGVAAHLAHSLAGDRGPDALVAELASALGLPVESVLNLSVNVDDISRTAIPLVERAREYPIRLRVSPLTHVRHLLAAVVIADPPLGPSVLGALGVSADELRARLRQAVREVVHDEAPEGWDELLALVTEATELAGGFAHDIVGGTERIPLTDDHLGVATYVTMLATVIARRDTRLPLSVGLFGEWGSGKSYFMGLLRDQVEKLGRSGDSYLRDTVQITFNAWHYADTNLWASLGNEIFEQLAGPTATAKERRTALRAELVDKMQEAQDLRSANERAERATARLREELERARAEAAGSAATLARSVTGSPTLRAELRTTWRRLGVSHEVEQGQLLAGELRQAGAGVDALRLATRGRRGWVPAGLAVVALSVLALTFFVAGAAERWLAGGGLAGLAGSLALFTAAVGRVRSGLRKLTDVAAEIRAEAEKNGDAQVAEDLQRLRRADAREAVLQSQLTEVLQRVGELGRELAALSPGQRWYGFVSERAASEDYRRELGLISTIRRDFEQLIELMDDWRHREEPDDEHRPIDRIVLYIDDLDRCSTRQVVDVLQAVHLLLALDLFVVVVGVDPRWLLHSLREQFRSIFRARDDRNGPMDSDVPDENALWRTTPHDYLEKIFNIPFVLPGMTSRSFERLIRELSLGEDGIDESTLSVMNGGGAGGDGPGGRPVADGLPVELAAPSGPDPGPAGEPQPTAGTTPVADVPVEGGSEVAAVGAGERPVPRRLSEDELKLLASLGPLVRSPRQAKRLLNLYRMVRSTRDLSPASAFLGTDTAPGEYQAVGVLLGLLTAHPRLLGELLSTPPTQGIAGGLCHRGPDASWQAVVGGLEPRRSGDGWRNDVSADLSEVDRREWTELVERVAPATRMVGLPDLTAFQLWGPRVARFSFLLSPLAVQEEPARPVERPLL